MSWSFQPGDVVVCVDVAPRGTPFDGSLTLLRAGSPYRVSEMILGGAGVILISILSSHPSGSFRSDRFRKIDADTTEDFREQMRSLAKARERTDA